MSHDHDADELPPQPNPCLIWKGYEIPETAGVGMIYVARRLFLQDAHRLPYSGWKWHSTHESAVGSQCDVCGNRIYNYADMETERYPQHIWHVGLDCAAFVSGIHESLVAATPEAAALYSDLKRENANRRSRFSTFAALPCEIDWPHKQNHYYRYRYRTQSTNLFLVHTSKYHPDRTVADRWGFAFSDATTAPTNSKFVGWHGSRDECMRAAFDYIDPPIGAPDLSGVKVAERKPFILTVGQFKEAAKLLRAGEFPPAHVYPWRRLYREAQKALRSL